MGAVQLAQASNASSDKLFRIIEAKVAGRFDVERIAHFDLLVLGSDNDGA
jgi:hypothetical protein